MFRLYCVVIGYAIGCIQTAYFTGKLISKIDIREHGSGNAGSTNVVRVLGTKAGIMVFALDILKGAAGYALCAMLFDGSGIFMNGANELTPGLYGGLGVILGHDFPFYLKFRGGKGVASSVGVMLCSNPVIAFIDYAITALLIAVTKYVSLASLIMLALYPIMLFILKYSAESVFVAAVITCITYFKHSSNIARLIKGNENKFTFRRQKIE